MKPGVHYPNYPHYRRHYRGRRMRIRVRRWDSAEERYVVEHYPTEIARVIGKRLDRTATAVQMRARKLGVYKRHLTEWTKKEVRLLKKLYPRDTSRNVARALKKSLNAVNGKAALLGLQQRTARWSAHERKIVRQYYTSQGATRLARQMPRRTPVGIQTYANSIGLHYFRPGTWSENEYKTLREYYPQHGLELTAKKLGRSVLSVKNKVKRLGIRSERTLEWTTEHDAYLRKHAATQSRTEMGRELRFTYSTIARHMHELNLPLLSKKSLTEREETYVRRWYKTKTYKEIGEALGRSPNVIGFFVRSHGFHKRVMRRFTKSEERHMLRLLARMPVPDVARAMGRSAKSIALAFERLQRARKEKKPGK